MKRTATFMMFGLAMSMSFADGFDGRYTAHVGHLNADGLPDIYFKHSPQIVIVDVGGITTPIVVKRREVGQFALQNATNGTFQIVSLDASQIAQASQWPAAPIGLRAQDANFDAHVDLMIDGLDSVISGAYDQTVFAGDSSSALPIQITALTAKRATFLSEMFAWLMDHDYFYDNAPWKITSVLPPSASWYGALAGLGSVISTNMFIDRCRQGGQYSCGVSTVDPAVCIRNVDRYNLDGVYLGMGTQDVCLSQFHIYRYTPGTVTVEKDYGRFDPDALEAADVIISTFPNGLDDIYDLDGDNEPLESVNDDIAAIIKEQMGEDSMGEEPTETTEDHFEGLCASVDRFSGEKHTEIHPPFPFDGSFTPSDPTFHHYDNGFPPVCNTEETYCIYDVWDSYVLPLFSFPSRQLKPKATYLDGTTPELAYMTSPWTMSLPSAYIVPIGWITQIRLTAAQSQDWEDAIVNTTVGPVNDRSQHWMHPGHVARTAQPTSTGQRIFTHGIGENEYENPVIDSQAVRFLLGCANDINSQALWRTVDREARKFWLRNWSNPQSPSGEPEFMSIPQQAQ